MMDELFDLILLAALGGVGFVLRHMRKRPPGPGETALDKEIARVLRDTHHDDPPTERTGQCHTSSHSRSRSSH